MLHTAQHIERLLRQLVDTNAQVYEHEAQVSPYLAGQFSLYMAEVSGMQVIFAESDDDDYGRLRKRLGLLSDAPVVLYTSHLPQNVRRHFLEHGVPFVTGTGDVYLPFVPFR